MELFSNPNSLFLFIFLNFFNHSKFFSVIFTTLNFERTNIVLSHLFLEANGQPFSAVIAKNDEGEKIEKTVGEIVEKLEIEKVEKIEERPSNNILLINNLLKNSKNNSKVEKSPFPVKKIEIIKAIEKIGKSMKKESIKSGVRPMMQSLTPVQVAVREPILLPTRYIRSS